MDGDGERIEATLALRRSGRGAVGRDRIRLLEELSRLGSIAAAAEAVGLSYKGAWEALNAVNNLLPRPVFAAQSGGRHGGGASLTAEGEALIRAFRLLEDRLDRVTDLLAAGGPGLDPPLLLSRLGLRTTAGNAIRGRIESLRPDGVNQAVTLRLNQTVTLTALVTADSAADLALTPGQEVTALIAASLVVLAPGPERPASSAANALAGRVARRDDGPVGSAVAIDLGEGKTLSAMITRTAAEDLALAPGDPVWALVQAAHVVIAID